MVSNYLPLSSLRKSISKYVSVGGNALPPSVDVIPDPNNKLDPIRIGETKFLLAKLDTSEATKYEDFPTLISEMGCEEICLQWKRTQVTPAPKTQSPSMFKD